MRKRTMRNIVFGIKTTAICGAAVFTFAGIRNTYGAAKSNATSMIVQAETVSAEKYVQTEQQETETTEPEVLVQEVQSKFYSTDWDAEDAYLLAKIAMAEAEGEDTEGKALVMIVVLNRVWSDEFPNTISEVIYQEGQFSPVASGRFDEVEPNEDCYKALDLIQLEKWDESQGAIYFESASASTWHRNHLQLLFIHGKHYFYTDKE